MVNVRALVHFIDTAPAWLIIFKLSAACVRKLEHPDRDVQSPFSPYPTTKNRGKVICADFAAVLPYNILRNLKIYLYAACPGLLSLDFGSPCFL